MPYWGKQPLRHIVYMSSCTKQFTDNDLAQLLESARFANFKNQITGVLLYNHGHICQLIEGTSEAVEELYARLEQDPRHTGLVRLADKPIAMRSFAEWSMAYKPVNEHTFEELRGYVNPSEVDFSQQQLSQVDTLLLTTLKGILFTE